MKKKIYCLLGNSPFLEPTSGDRINEINVYRTLNEFFEVYYNNRKLDFLDKKYFGTNPKDIITQPSNDYDFYYIRNNEKIFNNINTKGKKLYFSVPNHQSCYKKADAIVYITETWKNNINRNDKEEYFCNIYSKDNYIPKKSVVFNQITNPIDLKTHPKTLEFRKKVNGDFIIGHFGRVDEGNYPYEFLDIIDDFVEFNQNIKIKIIYVGNMKLKINSKHIDLFDFIPIEDLPYAVSACDVVLMTQDKQANFCGSLKIIDSLSYGIPVICPKYDARVDELGEEYPLFYQTSEDILRNLQIIVRNKNKYLEIREYLFNRAKYYTLEESSIRYRNHLNLL